MQRRGWVATLVAISCALALSGLSYLGSQRDTAQAAPAAAVLPGSSAVGMAALFEVSGPPEPEPAAEPDPEPEDIGPRRAAFEERYPDQASAEADPETGGDTWALLIGINEHLGNVGNNVASRQDAERLHALLLREGWAEDRIVLLTDTDATGDMIREGLSWLARKASDEATVVFHYSGHSKKWYGDGGAITDLAIWPTDDDFVRRGELAEGLADVPHATFWGNVASCEAAGFHVPGAAGDARVWTYSSEADEKSYEDPSTDHSVWGRFLLDEGMWQLTGEPPSVQEAFVAAAPRATHYTSLQEPFGPQTPVLVDDLGRPFELAAAPAPAPVPVADYVRITPTIG